MKNFALMLAGCAIALSACKAQQQPVAIPTAQEVGALVMPEKIAPITGAPFDMPELKKPEFPALTVSIAERGANPDTPITSIVNELIVEVSEKGGGMVVIPAGQWKSARITLKSNVNLHIAEGAEIEFSGIVADWLPAVFTRHEGIELFGAGAFIYANGEDNIAVTGKGTLIGPAMESEVRNSINVATVTEIAAPLSMPLEERLFDGMEGREFQPPRTIAPINCTNVFIEGITMKRSAIWNVVPTYCENVIIRGITVNSIGIPRGDGIDVESSKNVLIEYCTLNTIDDSFTLKSGRAEEGFRIGKPTENVVIRYCLATEGAGGVTCGSETAGNIKNVYVHDCVFDGTKTGILFKTRRPRSGGTESAYYERIRMIGVNTAIRWDLLGSRTWVGDLANRLPLREVTERTPVLRNIHIKDFIVESAGAVVIANCIPEMPLANVLIENGEIKANKLISAINDVDGFTLRNLTITAEDNKINILDGRNVLFENVKFNVPGDELVVNVKGDESRNILFRNDGKDFEAKGTVNNFSIQEGVIYKQE